MGNQSHTKSLYPSLITMFSKLVFSVLMKRVSLVPRRLDDVIIKPVMLFNTSSSLKSTYSSVSQIFARIATVSDETVVGQVNAVLQFNLIDDAKYYVDLKTGTGLVGEGDAPTAPDVTLTLDADTLIKMFNREILATTAITEGKVKVEGDLLKAASLQEALLVAKESGK